jgi:hypothetical protein
MSLVLTRTGFSRWNTQLNSSGLSPSDTQGPAPCRLHEVAPSRGRTQLRFHISKANLRLNMLNMQFPLAPNDDNDVNQRAGIWTTTGEEPALPRCDVDQPNRVGGQTWFGQSGKSGSDVAAERSWATTFLFTPPMHRVLSFQRLNAKDIRPCTFPIWSNVHLCISRHGTYHKVRSLCARTKL